MASIVPSESAGSGLKVAVLVAQWHPDVVRRLADAARDTLGRSGVAADDVLVVEVPGAFELPQAAMYVARAGLADAIVALGCIVRGETPHFEHVARACVDGLLRAGLETGIPVALGVITADTLEQAKARSGASGGVDRKGGNKGVEAAEAAVRLAASFKALDRRRRS